MAFRHVRRRPLQSLLTILGVTVGVAVLIIALALTNGFIDELIESTLQATPHVTLQAYDARPFEAAGELRERIEEHPQVVAAAPYLSGQALIARRANTSLGISGRSGFTQLLGIDVELEQRVLGLPALRQGEVGQEEQAGIILGESLAIRQLGVYPGDEVFVRDIDGRSASFTVLDTFFVGNELIDSVTAYLPLESLQGFLRAPDPISGFHVRVAEPQEAARVGLELVAAGLPAGAGPDTRLSRARGGAGGGRPGGTGAGGRIRAPVHLVGAALQQPAGAVAAAEGRHQRGRVPDSRRRGNGDRQHPGTG